jgi:hypothetical protein
MKLGALCLLPLALAGCEHAPDPSLGASSAEPWPEADALFHEDPRWLGADDAYSVDLGGGRVLWLFADTFIATSDAGVRSESKLIRNSIALQTGYDPSAAAIQFFWNDAGGLSAPASFFPEEGDVWYWPGDGERVGDKVVVYLMAVRAASGGLGFEVFDSDAVLIENPDDDPSAWSVSKLATPVNDRSVIVGSASVLADGDHLYAFGEASGSSSHPMHIARFPLSAITPGGTLTPEWVEPSPAFDDGQTELTVHHDPARAQWIAVQTRGFGSTEIALRTSPALAGPWSSMTDIYHPPESDRSDTLVYAAKAHPELTSGGALVVTYVSNSTDFGTLVSDASLYYPRFVRVTLESP